MKKYLLIFFLLSSFQSAVPVNFHVAPHVRSLFPMPTYAAVVCGVITAQSLAAAMCGLFPSLLRKPLSKEEKCNLRKTLLLSIPLSVMGVATLWYNFFELDN